MENIEKVSSVLQSQQHGALSCEGCSTQLQSSRLDKYGYIEAKALAESIGHNQRILSEQTENTDDTIRLIREVEQELGVEVLDSKGGPLKNLDNLEVLMRIE